MPGSKNLQEIFQEISNNLIKLVSGSNSKIDSPLRAEAPQQDDIKDDIEELTVATDEIETITSEDDDNLSSDQTQVRLIVNNAETSLGQNVYVVGNIDELGNWEPSEAVGPMDNQLMYQYPTWYIDVSVPKGTQLEFKFIKKDESGGVVWEEGLNHTYTTPVNELGEVESNWCN